jgi:DNA invertase Pin-like site-specific DNA recombinase
MLIGYARVSTDHQEAAAQVAALKSAGCKRIYQKASGGSADRRELQKLLTQIQNGDVLVVWKLGRLSRSLRDILELMDRLSKANVRFRSLTEAVDTTTPAGRMTLHIVSSFAEYERAALHERTRSGLALARQGGRIGGRRPKLTIGQQQKLIRMVFEGKTSGADAARLFGIHPATVSRLLTRSRTG